MIAFLLLLDLMTGNLFLLFILAVVLTNEQIVNDISACVTPCHADEFVIVAILIASVPNLQFVLKPVQCLTYILRILGLVYTHVIGNSVIAI